MTKEFFVLTMATESSYKNIRMGTCGLRRRASACVKYHMVAFRKLSSYWWLKMFPAIGLVDPFLFFFRLSSSNR